MATRKNSDRFERLYNLVQKLEDVEKEHFKNLTSTDNNVKFAQRLLELQAQNKDLSTCQQLLKEEFAHLKQYSNHLGNTYAWAEKVWVSLVAEDLKNGLEAKVNDYISQIRVCLKIAGNVTESEEREKAASLWREAIQEVLNFPKGRTDEDPVCQLVKLLKWYFDALPHADEVAWQEFYLRLRPKYNNLWLDLAVSLRGAEALFRDNQGGIVQQHRFYRLLLLDYLINTYSEETSEDLVIIKMKGQKSGDELSLEARFLSCYEQLYTSFTRGYTRSIDEVKQKMSQQSYPQYWEDMFEKSLKEYQTRRETWAFFLFRKTYETEVGINILMGLSDPTHKTLNRIEELQTKVEAEVHLFSDHQIPDFLLRFEVNRAVLYFLKREYPQAEKLLAAIQATKGKKSYTIDSELNTDIHLLALVLEYESCLRLRKETKQLRRVWDTVTSLVEQNSSPFRKKASESLGSFDWSEQKLKNTYKELSKLNLSPLNPLQYAVYQWYGQK